MPDQLNIFIEELIKGAGLDKMPKDFLDEFTWKLTEEAKKRLGIMAVAELKSDEVLELNKIIEKNKKEKKDGYGEINDYLVSHIPDYPEKMKKALEEFAGEVIKNAGRGNELPAAQE